MRIIRPDILPFSDAWFKHWQPLLLGILNSPMPRLRSSFREKLGITGISDSLPIVRITGNAYHFYYGKKLFGADFRTKRDWAIQLRKNFVPFWCLLHVWDMAIANRFCPSLNLGFDNFTTYPEPDPETDTCDGYVYHGEVAAGNTWAHVHDSDGTGHSDVNLSSTYLVRIRCGTTTSYIRDIYRYIATFDCRTLPASYTLDSATFSIYSGSKLNQLSGTVPCINLYSASPAANNDLINGDYDTLGSTAFSSAISYTNWHNIVTQYENFALNADGLANISDAIVGFGLRESIYDAANSAPTWGSGNEFYLQGYHADYTGTDYDPKLVVNYTVTSSIAKAILLMALVGM